MGGLPVKLFHWWMAMAVRNLLHVNSLNDFKDFLTRKGIDHRDGKGNLQVLQVLIYGKYRPIYRSIHATEHLSTPDELTYLIKTFIQESRSSAVITLHTDSAVWLLNLLEQSDLPIDRSHTSKMHLFDMVTQLKTALNMQ